MIVIRTNHQWRDLVYRSDVPAKVLKDQFEHLSEDDATDGFFCYRGWWYHTSDFIHIDGNEELAGWDGYSGDSFFSGVLIKFSHDGEHVMCATYLS